MTPQANTAKRAALVVGLALAAVLGIYFAFLAPPAGERKGVGISLALELQETWRGELARQGRHLNDLEPYQIQEGIARRMGVQAKEMNGIVKLARHATLQPMQARAYLLGGDYDLAAPLLDKLAAGWEKTYPRTAARARRDQGDALWRAGDRAGAAAAYEEGLKLLRTARGGKDQPAAVPPELKDLGIKSMWPDGETSEQFTSLLMDSALLHWSQANFHPEDLAAELTATAAALEEAISLLGKDQRLDHAAALRLRGDVLAWQAVLPEEGDADIRRLDSGLLLGAETISARSLLMKSLGMLSRETEPEIWADTAQDLGVVLSMGTPADLQEAEKLFSGVLEVRTGKLPDGASDVAALGKALSLRADTLACKALVLARQAARHGPESAAPEAENALDVARQALELSTSQEPGATWFIARYAQGLATQEKARTLPKAQGDTPSSPSAARAKGYVEAADTLLDALQNYPLDRLNHPGVPHRQEVLWSLNRVCNELVSSTDRSAELAAVAKRVRDVVRPIYSAADRDTMRETRKVTLYLLTSAMTLQAAATTDPQSKAALRAEAQELATEAARLSDSSFNDTVIERKGLDPFRIPWPPGRLWEEQMQRMNELLERLGHE